MLYLDTFAINISKQLLKKIIFLSCKLKKYILISQTQLTECLPNLISAIFDHVFLKHRCVGRNEVPFIEN